MSFQTAGLQPDSPPPSNRASLPPFNPGPANSSRESIRNILFLRADSIGDAVLSVAMIPAIARKFPETTISVVCTHAAAPVFETCPQVSRIIMFDKNRAIQDSVYRDELVTQIRELRADLLLNTVYSRDALCDFLAANSGAAFRIAHCGDLSNIDLAQRQINDQIYQRLLPSPGTWKLESQRNDDFLRGLDIHADHIAPTLWLTPEDHDAARSLLAQHNFTADKTIVLFASAQYDVRTYPNFGQALNAVCREQNLAIIAIGSAAEFALNQYALNQAAARSLNLCGKTSLRQSAALIHACRMSVGVESGASHIACALGKPNVILLGGGHFGRFMPYSPLTSIVCNPLSCFGCNWSCRHTRAHCVKDVAPEVIEVALREALEGPSEFPRIYMQHSAFAPPPPATEPFFGVDLLPPMAFDFAYVVPQDSPELTNPAPTMLGRPIRYIHVPRQRPSTAPSAMNVQGVSSSGSVFVSFDRKL